MLNASLEIVNIAEMWQIRSGFAASRPGHCTDFPKFTDRIPPSVLYIIALNKCKCYTYCGNRKIIRVDIRILERP